jgi:hypothetical protein
LDLEWYWEAMVLFFGTLIHPLDLDGVDKFLIRRVEQRKSSGPIPMIPIDPVGATKTPTLLANHLGRVEHP